MKRRLLLIIFILMPLTILVAQEQSMLTIKGHIIDVDREPLAYVTVRAANFAYALSDEKGNYELRFRKPTSGKLVLYFSLVGKQALKREIEIGPNTHVIKVEEVLLQDHDLYMDEVEVTAQRDEENVSNSAYKIDRTAVEQARANNLSDLLQMAPGQTVKNPMLHGAQTITFRSSNISSQDALNNAFGIGIFINGSQLTKNADMQGVNPVQRGAFDSYAGSQLNGTSYAPSDNPGGGFDLRQIPVGNVEKVELVQGVASAEYGDITEGAIIVETIAGKSPLNFAVRYAGGNTNVFANKGFQLNERNSLSVGLDYVYSNANPIDRMKSYNQVNGNALWTTYIGAGKKIRNNLSMNFNTNLDDFKSDPDIGYALRNRYQRRAFSVSDKISLNYSTPIFDGLEASINYSYGESTSETIQLINRGVTGVTDVTEEGVHEGTFTPGTYTASMRVHGKPISAGARLNFSKEFNTGKWKHALSYGYNLSYSANRGDGRVFDPFRPISGGSSPTSDRPYSFRDVQPELVQQGFYVQNGIKGKLLDKDLNLSLGVRGDLQVGYFTVSPRINARYKLAERWSLTGAYGIQTKAPGLVHLYPGPSYEDVILLNSFNGKVNESLYLAYTHVETSNAQGLEPMLSKRHEIGVNYKSKGLSLAFTYFGNQNAGGISIDKVPLVVEVSDYEITGYPEGSTPEYAETGETKKYAFKSNRITNTNYTDSRGFELMGAIPKVDALNASFNFWLSYYNTISYSLSDTYKNNNNDGFFVESDYVYVLYPPTWRQSGRLQGSLSTNYHLSSLGLLISLRVESFIYNYTRSKRESDRAKAYFDQNLDYVFIPESERNDSTYDLLAREGDDALYSENPPVAYFNAHLNLSKNISKNIRFTFFANNFLNIRPEGNYRLSSGEESSYGPLNQAPYFGMELNFKF
ncbi:TonB-dependent receptor domain-containing protein [Echinicola sp. 20G]|uniref:TonB-dependent receptor n=1 Tax=Echinicola sp. 20G TaxID=2781961 RepID=UPI00191029C3|nr:TonB-dependent receptor [Echinicola sp. 20G]